MALAPPAPVTQTDLRSSETLRAAACHEAGHYTIARLLKVRFPGWKARILRVSLIPDREAGVGGVVNIKVYRHCGPKSMAVLFLGGMAAESYWQQLYGDHRILEGYDSLSSSLIDQLLEKIDTLANMQGASDLKSVRSHIGDLDWIPFATLALELVHCNWQPLLRVANALLGRRLLTSTEANEAFLGENSLSDSSLLLYLAERLVRAAPHENHTAKAEAEVISGFCLTELGLWQEGRRRLELAVRRFDKFCGLAHSATIQIAHRLLSEGDVNAQTRLSAVVLERAHDMATRFLDREDLQRLEALMRRRELNAQFVAVSG